MLILCVIWVMATWNGLITHTAADHRYMMWQIYGWQTHFRHGFPGKILRKLIYPPILVTIRTSPINGALLRGTSSMNGAFSIVTFDCPRVFICIHDAIHWPHAPHVLQPWPALWFHRHGCGDAESPNVILRDVEHTMEDPIRAPWAVWFRVSPVPFDEVVLSWMILMDYIWCDHRTWGPILIVG